MHQFGQIKGALGSNVGREKLTRTIAMMAQTINFFLLFTAIGLCILFFQSDVCFTASQEPFFAQRPRLPSATVNSQHRPGGIAVATHPGQAQGQ
jgi:hypothetical protein